MIFFPASGKPVDATQELIAVGICNIGNSFVQSFPGSGSLSRSAVNEASGVRTPLGGLYTGMSQSTKTLINSFPTEETLVHLLLIMSMNLIRVFIVLYLFLEKKNLDRPNSHILDFF